MEKPSFSDPKRNIMVCFSQVALRTEYAMKNLSGDVRYLPPFPKKTGQAVISTTVYLNKACRGDRHAARGRWKSFSTARQARLSQSPGPRHRIRAPPGASATEYGEIHSPPVRQKSADWHHLCRACYRPESARAAVERRCAPSL